MLQLFIYNLIINSDYSLIILVIFVTGLMQLKKTVNKKFEYRNYITFAF